MSPDEFEQVMFKPKGQLKTSRIVIDKLLGNIRASIEKMPQFSFPALELDINKVHKSALDIFPYFVDRYTEYMNDDRVKTASLYRTTMNSLRGFQSSISFYDITPQFLSRYDKHLRLKGITSTTVGVYLRNLRAIYNQAVQDGILKNATNPFGKKGFLIPQPRKGKQGLDLDEVRKLRSTTDFHSVAEEAARDFWIFLYLCNGLNPSDALRLRWSDIEGCAITLIRKKTARSSNGSLPVIIFLLPETRQIIDKYGDKTSEYVFGALRPEMTELEKITIIEYRIDKTNKYMKRLAARLGFQNSCTTVIARHTFAQVLKHQDAGVDLISESVGHSTQKSTGSYLNSFKLDKMKEVAYMLL